jgi:hypothetical protein
MTTQEGKDLSKLAMEKPAMPLYLENELTPLKCDALTEDFNSYKEAVAKTLKANIELLKELPPPRNFTIEDLLAYFEKELKKNIEKDAIFEKSVQVSRYANSMYEAMGKYFKEIYDLHAATKKRNSICLHELSKYFINSNLDERFLESFSNSYLVSNDYLDLYDNRVRKESHSLLFFKNNKAKFERVCIAHNRWVKDFQDNLTLIAKNRTKLFWYVDINNSKTVEDLFKDKSIETNVLNKKILNNLIAALEGCTTNLESMVSKNTDLATVYMHNVDDSIKTMTTLMDLANR